jgi:hypothetical protein
MIMKWGDLSEKMREAWNNEMERACKERKLMKYTINPKFKDGKWEGTSTNPYIHGAPVEGLPPIESILLKDIHSPGAKADDGKPDLDLVLGDFARALEVVGEIGTAGAKKYSEHGWLSVPNGIRRYLSAGWRHVLKFRRGEIYDYDSKQLHLGHAAWNALAVLELYLREQDGKRKTIDSIN